LLFCAALNYHNLDVERFKTAKKKEYDPMKKITVSFVFSLFLFSILASPVVGQTTDDIVAKMIKAQGGKAALEKIKDSTLTGTMDIVQMGMSGSLTYYQKEPNKMRMDMEIMGMAITQAFDGESAWGIDPQTGSVQDMPEDQAKEMKRQSLGNDALLHPEKYGITYAYKGKETLEGKEYYVLEQTFEDGFIMTLYIDTKTDLLYKSKSKGTSMMGMEVDQEVFVSDYKEVEGLMVAHVMRIIQDGEEAITMTFTDIKFNSGLEDSLFKKD
jgi:outer membrane lipoprotein-sorting protein